MIWGTFTPLHIATLILSVLIIMGLYYALRGASLKMQTWVLFVLSLSGIADHVYNLLMWGVPMEYLPLHLCSLNAMLLPIVVLTKNRVMGNLLLVWALGALIGLVANFAMAHVDIFSGPFYFYFFPHTLEFGIPILLFKLGHIQKDPRCIGSTLGITMGAYTIVHFLNKRINEFCEENSIVDGAGEIIDVNYMFSLEPENPILDLFYNILPLEYWYMYLAVPIIAVYLLIVYAPQFLARRKARAAT